MKPIRPIDGVENLMHLSGVIFNEEMKKAMLRPSNRKPINKLTNISNLQNETIAPRII